MSEIQDEIVARFDSYTKSAFGYCMYHLRKKARKMEEKEMLVDDLEVLHFAVEDNDTFAENYIQVLDFDLMIKNDLLYEALRSLEKAQRDIIYLSVCEHWSDRRIGLKMNMSRSKVQRIKTKVTNELKKIMIGDVDNEK